MVKATFKIEDGSFNGEFLGLTFRNKYSSESDEFKRFRLDSLGVAQKVTLRGILTF